ncbi:MAG: hypothetical protein E6H08_04635 [Bacteroidetes bacterium]|nr:MAG: hypothetical protein E6H08_04635 [Bacteroidota bacterium]
MKKNIFYFLLLAIPAASFCQQTNDTVPSIKTDYLVKSKNQKTAAWILLGGGAALIGTGFLIGDSKNSTFDDAVNGAFLGAIGTLSTIGSIPLFIASGKNKRRAMKTTTFIKMETAPSFQGQSYIQNSYPAFSVNITF